MTHIEEFSLIAEQLAWLEQYLRAPSSTPDRARVEDALKALVCARAVLEQLAQIGAAIEQPATSVPTA